MQLRDYQEDGLQALWSYFMTKKGNPVVAWPTGTGKSLLPAEFIRRTMKLYPRQRFILATHVKELIRQNFEELVGGDDKPGIWPGAPAGIYSAGLKRRNVIDPIIYGGVQSMYKIAEAFGHRDILFIDEAHLVSPDDATMYFKLISVLKAINPHLKIIGMSATPYRIGQGMITDGGLFTDIVHDLTSLENFNKLIADGYLAPLIPKKTNVELDVSNVGIQQGEFNQKQLQFEVDRAEITWKGIQEFIHHAQNRRSGLLYASGIEHAEHIAQMMQQLGAPCAAVHSKQSDDYNDAALKAHKKGELPFIVSYSKLTTGLNHPMVDIIGVFRPTMSVALWVQMLGRGTRIYLGKQNCIAEGSLVLTQNGLVPIEQIQLSDKVWDGEEFVSHDGLIYQGYKEVVEYDGLLATRDHKVYTKEGWQTFGECFEKRIGIAITGIGRKAIQLSENHFSRNSISKTIIHFNRMYDLLKTSMERFHQCNFEQSRLPQMRKFKWRFAEMAHKALFSSKTTLHQSKEPIVSELRWSWNKIQFQFASSNGYMGKGKSWIKERIKYRQKRQQWSLRNWQSKIFDKFRKHVQPQISKKHVFDIANAGKHNRFTVNGLLVSNCLVLDFAKNAPRLGPINDPVIPKKKGDKTGTVPIKLCGHCGVYHHIKAVCCDVCGTPFEFEIKITERAGTDELIAEPETVQIDTFDVTYMLYNKKESREGKNPYLKVTYFSGINGFDEYVFPEASYRKHFVDWWRQRHSGDAPHSVDEVLRVTSELRQPKRIRVHTNRRYKGRPSPEVLSVEF